jgi:hypothetical protein
MYRHCVSHSSNSSANDISLSVDFGISFSFSIHKTHIVRTLRVLCTISVCPCSRYRVSIEVRIQVNLHVVFSTCRRACCPPAAACTTGHN